ncbi:MAG TPA: FAD-binding oxidoreductase [Candidatus Dormibacteraeota bacterium]|nr:FAD-binding oxidoreductase [Candidatus Dormibacteraeota bacterium]
MIAGALEALRVIPDLDFVEGSQAGVYRIGEQRARVAVRPRTHEAAAAALHACAQSNLSVVPFGGGTGQSLGHPPHRIDVVLSLEHLRGIHAYDPRDLTISVEAGTPVCELDAALARSGQHLPLDAPLTPRATIGGILASGHFGWRASAYGRPRDLLIGMRVALADGTLASSGGMVVKNVTGYDLGKLHAGALGTLGVVLRANFKVFPFAPVRRYVAAPLPEGTLAAIVARLDTLVLRPTAAVVVRGWDDDLPRGETGDAGRVAIVLEGAEGEIDRATRELRSALGAAGIPSATLRDGTQADEALAQLNDLWRAEIGGRSAAYRIRGDAERIEAWATMCTVISEREQVSVDFAADALDGTVLVRIAAPSGHALRAALPACEEAIRAEDAGARILHAPEWARREFAVWGVEPGALGRMREIKRAYDPAGALNPGRYVGKI